MMEEKLKPAIHSCHCGHLSKGVPFLHDTVWPHTAATTVTTIQKLKSETINPPLTVQTLLHLSSMRLAHLRKHCKDTDFTVMTRWRRQCISGFDNNQKFFSTAIQKLLERCEKCIAKDSDCVEKLHLTWICIYDVHVNVTQFVLTYWCLYVILNSEYAPLCLIFDECIYQNRHTCC
jgi:hypothetical protein